MPSLTEGWGSLMQDPCHPSPLSCTAALLGHPMCKGLDHRIGGMQGPPTNHNVMAYLSEDGNTPLNRCLSKVPVRDGSALLEGRIFLAVGWETFGHR